MEPRAVFFCKCRVRYNADNAAWKEEFWAVQSLDGFLSPLGGSARSIGMGGMGGGSKNRSVEIEGAGRGRAGTFHDVEINDGGFDAGVAEK